MTGYEAYSTYIRLKAHFKDPNFDFFKYKKTRASKKTFERRNDRHFFDKLSKKHSDCDIVDFLVSQLKDNPDLWIGDMFSEDAYDRHTRRMKNLQAMSHRLEIDTKLMVDQSDSDTVKFGNLFVPPCNGCHPRVFCLLLQKKITDETFLSYDLLIGFTESWNRKLQDDPIWQDMGMRLRKYGSFVPLEYEVVKATISRVLAETILTKQ